MIQTHTARVAPEKTDYFARPAAMSIAECFGESKLKLTYFEQLKHPQWQKKRLEMLEAAGWSCSQCEGKETTLHVHHKQYIKGRMAWEYSQDELLVLCEDCHEEEHCMSDGIKELLLHVDSTQVLALLRGFYATADWFDPWIGDNGRDRNPYVYAIGFAAHLMTFVDIGKHGDIAKFICELTSKDSEARMLLKSNQYIFGES